VRIGNLQDFEQGEMSLAFFKCFLVLVLFDTNVINGSNSGGLRGKGKTTQEARGISTDGGTHAFVVMNRVHKVENGEIDEDGEVNCEFRGNDACPAASTLPQMAVYRNNNSIWLDDFKDALEKMLVQGCDDCQPL